MLIEPGMLEGGGGDGMRGPEGSGSHNGENYVRQTGASRKAKTIAGDDERAPYAVCGEDR